MKASTIVWFQNDLRLEDNPAFIHGIKSPSNLIPIFIWDEERDWFSSMGEASRWWLHHSLEALSQSLKKLGLDLLIFKGKTDLVLQELVGKNRVEQVLWNRRYDPSSFQSDKKVSRFLDGLGVESSDFPAYTLFEPDRIRNKSGGIYKVFTPFWKCCLQFLDEIQPLAFPTLSEKVQTIPLHLGSYDCLCSIGDLGLLPQVKWDRLFEKTWNVGEKNASLGLNDFLNTKATQYKLSRDIPSVVGTSRLSAALHFGEISPRQVVQATREQFGDSGLQDPGVACYLSELGWREFSTHLLYHFSELPQKSLRPEFEKFPWQNSNLFLKAWQKGCTGIPMVDAGMRELWQTGWMHNRVRMIVASFLVKNLMVDWRLGAEWFSNSLVDADIASNVLSWQWVAGCGVDASPYYRIFNPVTQGQKFDPEGEYVKKWIPELCAIPKKWVHCPWEANEDLQNHWGLGDDYPKPIVDLKESRQIALDAYQSIK